MPRRGSPYGPAHQRRRKALIVPGAKCHRCGAQASELDHVPPLTLHDHVEGSGCCTSLPACGPCQRAQADALGRNRYDTPAQPPVAVVAEPDDSPGPGAAVWDVPWPRGLPRAARVGHLAAVYDRAAPRRRRQLRPPRRSSSGSKTEAGIELRYFQQLALTRELSSTTTRASSCGSSCSSHTSRQVGKSVLLRGGATWRLHQAELFGEEQTIMHTGKDLPVCKEVQRLARQWAKARAYPVREQNGNEEITEPLSDSRWMVRGKDSVYGYSVSFGLVDEAWGVAPGVVEDGIEPTMAERHSPQLVLASTAHRRATSLFPTHRTAALDQLDEPTSTLLIEWSAHRDAPRSTTSPPGAKRRRIGAKAVSACSPSALGGCARARRSTPTRPTRSSPSAPSSSTSGRCTRRAPRARRAGRPRALARPRGERRRAAARLGGGGRELSGGGQGVVAVADVGEGRYEVDGWTCKDRDSALESARRTIEVLGVPGRLSVAPSLVSAAPTADKATPADERFGLPLLRELVESGRLVHDATPELDVQLAECRVRPVSGGLTLATPARSDLVRAAALAARAAVVSSPVPAIY